MFKIIRHADNYTYKVDNTINKLAEDGNVTEGNLEKPEDMSEVLQQSSTSLPENQGVTITEPIPVVTLSDGATITLKGPEKQDDNGLLELGKWGLRHRTFYRGTLNTESGSAWHTNRSIGREGLTSVGPLADMMFRDDGVVYVRTHGEWTQVAQSNNNSFRIRRWAQITAQDITDAYNAATTDPSQEDKEYWTAPNEPDPPEEAIPPQDDLPADKDPSIANDPPTDVANDPSTDLAETPQGATFDSSGNIVEEVPNEPGLVDALDAIKEQGAPAAETELGAAAPSDAWQAYIDNSVSRYTQRAAGGKTEGGMEDQQREKATAVWQAWMANHSKWGENNNGEFSEFVDWWKQEHSANARQTGKDWNEGRAETAYTGGGRLMWVEEAAAAIAAGPDQASQAHDSYSLDVNINGDADSNTEKRANILSDLIKLTNHLDLKGVTNEANMLDKIINRIAK